METLKRILAVLASWGLLAGLVAMALYMAKPWPKRATAFSICDPMEPCVVRTQSVICTSVQYPDKTFAFLDCERK